MRISFLELRRAPCRLFAQRMSFNDLEDRLAAPLISNLSWRTDTTEVDPPDETVQRLGQGGSGLFLRRQLLRHFCRSIDLVRCAAVERRMRVLAIVVLGPGTDPAACLPQTLCHSVAASSSCRRVKRRQPWLCVPKTLSELMT